MRPVDMQVVIPKVTEIAKDQQTLKDASYTMQTMLGVQFQKRQDVKRQKVNLTSKAENLQVTSEKERGKEEKNKKRGKSPSKNCRHIDVKI